jgi:tRNA threonylcarbamoyladenosine biosynthesis protein TsaE
MEGLRRVLRSQSPEETRALGRALGQALKPGDFVGLSGELGAGKTELVRGLAEGAGVPPSEVSSPSFALVNTYEGRLRLHHADLYRLVDEEELFAMGWDDVVQSDAAVVAEWIDKVPGAAPHDALRLAMRDEGGDVRGIEVEARGPRSEVLLDDWLKSVGI